MANTGGVDAVDVRYVSVNRQSGDQRERIRLLCFFFEGKGRGDSRMQYATHGHRLFLQSVLIPPAGSVIWQILFSRRRRRRRRRRTTAASTTVRELISHRASVPAETSISPNMARAREQGEIPPHPSAGTASPQSSATRVIFTVIAISYTFALRYLF